VSSLRIPVVHPSHRTNAALSLTLGFLLKGRQPLLWNRRLKTPAVTP